MTQLEDVWRRESPHVLSALLRRHADLADCEDAAQDALMAAVEQWPHEGVPDNPRGWLVRVAWRRLVDRERSRAARVRREEADALAEVEDAAAADTDDSLLLLLLCCHPSLSRPSQVALTLRSVAGLTVEQVAAAYFVPTRTMTQRLTRARSQLREAGATFTLPTADELPDRVAAVLDVCHLVFNEGYTSTSGDHLVDADLAEEAIRLTRLLRAALPDHDEVAGALALMLLTHARAAARTDEHGDLVPLREQDRSRWDRVAIAEGVALLDEVLPRGLVGRFQLQAAIAAVHDEAATWDATDWPQIALLYAMLHDVAPGPAVTLNRAVAVAMTSGPEAGLAMLGPLLDEPAMRRHHRTHAVRAHLLEMAGDPGGALTAYQEAARLTASVPEQRYLNAQQARLSRSFKPGEGARS